MQIEVVVQAGSSAALNLRTCRKTSAAVEAPSPQAVMVGEEAYHPRISPVQDHKPWMAGPGRP